MTKLYRVKHQPAGGDVYRNRSSPGRVIYEGRREAIIRPLVRKENAEVGTSEISLATYQAACSPTQLRESIVGALVAGVSTRDVVDVQSAIAPGVSKSNVSRYWQATGH